MVTLMVVVVGGWRGKLRAEGRPGLAGLTGARSLPLHPPTTTTINVTKKPLRLSAALVQDRESSHMGDMGLSGLNGVVDRAKDKRRRWVRKSLRAKAAEKASPA